MTGSLLPALRGCEVFASLAEPDLVSLSATCGERSYGPGQIVFLRGDPGECMYVVARGEVAVSLAAENGRDVLLAVLKVGDAFGELAVVDSGPRVATVTARTPTSLVVIPRAQVADLLLRQPRVAAALLRSLAGTVRRLDEHACDVTTLDLPRRVQKYLAALAAHGEQPAPHTSPPDTGRHHHDFVPVELALNQTDLARQVGGSRQQINRILMDLEAAGAIARSGHRIVGIRTDLLSSDG